MSAHGAQSTVHLLLHAMVPSAVSMIICLALGFIIMSIHILNLSVNGVAYPNSSNDTFMQLYANHMVQPVASALNSSIFNNGATILLWGLAGLAVYAIIAGLAGMFAQWRATEEEVVTPREGVVIRHPLERSMLSRAAWRLLITIAAIGVTIAILPVVRWCLTNDWQLLENVDNVGHVLQLAAITTITWTLLFHSYLILLRLYLFRTRVFGELIY